jgi:hypothetical protein
MEGWREGSRGGKKREGKWPGIGKGGNEFSGLREGRERALDRGGSEEREENGGAYGKEKGGTGGRNL